MRRFGGLLLIFLLLLSLSCIDPLPLKNTAGKVLMVVDGMITDQPGPYTVKIYKTVSIYDQLDSMPEVSGATVTITDDDGVSETLAESERGVYRTSTTVGAVGKSYVLSITTADGSNYVSSTEKLLPNDDFSNLRFEFQEPEAPLYPLAASSTVGFQVYLDAAFDPSQTGLARWRWTGTFEIETFPELRTQAKRDRGDEPLYYVPDPPYCSGYDTITIAGKLTIQQNRPCTCCFCWDTQYSENPLVSNTSLVTSNKINNVDIAFIQANQRYFFNKYYLNVEQLSCSRAVYDFWKDVATQRSQNSDLFQTPPAVTGGNIQATTANAMPVIGIFSAASIRSHSITIQRTDVPYLVPFIDTLKVPCNEVYKNSSTTKPAFY